MIKKIGNWIARFLPTANVGDRREQMRACMGALVGLGWTGMMSYAITNNTSITIHLIAPMGASAVLLFCTPGSPLAQPWSIIGGNLVSGLIGVTCARFIGDLVLAASVAACLAIGAMFMLRCLHPPSGAVALTAVLGGPMVHAAGYHFVLMPIGLNSLLLVIAALLFNNMTGRRYPHWQPLNSINQKKNSEVEDQRVMTGLGFTLDDLNAALRRYNQVLDISHDDLESIFLQTELSAYQRRVGVITCAEIMSKQFVAVMVNTELNEAWRLMLQHRIKALTVLDQESHVVGIITQADILQFETWEGGIRLRMKLRSLYQRLRKPTHCKYEVVGHVMTTPAITVRESASIIELIPLMVDSELQHIPIVDDEDRAVGIVTQLDLVAALYDKRMLTTSISNMDGSVL